MKYQKKPVVVDAIQWTGSNLEEVRAFMAPAVPSQSLGIYPTSIFIDTLEGRHRADANDWIIKGVKGEFYPCKPGIFEQTYEKVED